MDPGIEPDGVGRKIERVVDVGEATVRGSEEENGGPGRSSGGEEFAAATQDFRFEIRGWRERLIGAGAGGVVKPGAHGVCAGRRKHDAIVEPGLGLSECCLEN